MIHFYLSLLIPLFFRFSLKITVPHTTFPEECLLVYEPTLRECVNRTVRYDYFSCYLGVKPSQRAEPHVLVVGNVGPMKNKVEIRSKTQLDVSEPISELILKSINFTRIVYNDESQSLESLRAMFPGIDIEITERQVEEESGVYISYVLAISNTERVITAFQTVCNHLEKGFELYQNASIEFVVCFFDRGQKPLDEVISIGPRLKQHMRVFHVFKTVNAFPEFELKNYAVQRSKGEFIVSANADCIPPETLFISATKRDLSPFTLIRSERSKSANNTVQHSLVEFTTERKTFIHLHSQASGDFEGMHRALWGFFHGFIEGYTLHVDTALLYEFAVFQFPVFLTLFPPHLHIPHDKTSRNSKMLDINRSAKDRLVCNAVQTYKQGEFRRDWKTFV